MKLFSTILALVLTLGLVQKVEAQRYGFTQTQKLLNHGNIYEKFYVKVKLTNGYTTEIPVINGYLPMIRTYEDNQGRPVKLTLDYDPIKYRTDNYRWKGYGEESIVSYVGLDSVGNYGNKKAPAPVSPNDLKGSEDYLTPDLPEKESGKAPAPVSPNLLKGSDTLNLPPSEKKNSHPSDEQINEMFDDLKNSSSGVKGEIFKRPSEVEESDDSFEIRPTYED